MAFPNELLQKLLSALKVTVTGGDYSIQGIDIAHQHVHDGEFFTANYQELLVANAGVIRLRFTTGANPGHLVITLNCEGKARFNTYSGTTYTDAGTTADGAKLTVFNRKSGGADPATTVRFNPTVNVLGTMRGNFTVFGGTGPQSTGSVSGDRVESLIMPNTDILITLTNVSGQPKDLEIILDWYE